MKKFSFWLITVITSLGFLKTSFGQDLDIHFSQFYHSPMVVNPGLVGSFSGDQRFSAVYRKQWYSVPVGYETFYASYDQKFYNSKLKNGLFGAGINIFYDHAGTSNLSLAHINLAGSYTQKLASSLYLTLGGLAGVNQRAYNTDGLTFDEQYNGTQHDPNLPSGENFTEKKKMYFDAGLGLNLHYQKNTRTQLDLGGGYYHLVSPEVDFFSASSISSPLTGRQSLFGNLTLQISNKWDVLVHVLGQFQTKVNQQMGGAALRYHIDTRTTRPVALQFGVDVRAKRTDAIIPVATVYYNRWLVGLSWDINVSQFKVATNKNGGPELAVQYIIHKIHPPLIRKNCPIF